MSDGMDRQGLGSARIMQGDALALDLPDSSVDLVVTSPPYFGLRSYQDAGAHYSGQIGSEATPAEFVDALIAATAEMVRVLKPSGSIWVNLGDKYAQTASQWQGSRRGQGGSLKGTKAERATQFGQSTWDDAPSTGSARPKSLIGVPWRYAIRCIDDLGLILRAEVIWSKPNGLPESVTDRVRRSHETWFHFTKMPRYFSGVDEIREAHTSAHPGKGGFNTRGEESYQASAGIGGTGKWNGEVSTLGKLPGSVWQIPTQPLTVPAHLGIDHFAAFPMEWPRRIIKGWSPAGVCTACGEGRRPVIEREPSDWERRKAAGEPMRHGLNGAAQSNAGGFAGVSGSITGYSCACPDTTAATTPGVVLDPFGGTGTTALVAKVLGRQGISNDMSADYCRLATWRTTDPDQIAAAMQVDKPAKQVEGQWDLFSTEVPS